MHESMSLDEFIWDRSVYFIFKSFICSSLASPVDTRGGAVTNNISTILDSNILGVLIFGLAIWMRMENEVREWVNELKMHQYWDGLYILMAAGLIVTIISFCGCFGALINNSCLLVTSLTLMTLSTVMLLMGAGILLANCIQPSVNSEKLREGFLLVLNRNNYISDEFLIFLVYRSAIIILICIVLELTGGIFLLVNGTEYSNLAPWLQRTFNKLIVDSNYNPQANYVLQLVQEKVGCCGSINYQDYDRARLPISDYCRDAMTGNVYQEGCVKKFSQFIEKRSGWIAGIALAVVALQIILVVLSFLRCRALREDEDGDGVRRKQRYDPVPLSSK